MAGGWKQDQIGACQTSHEPNFCFNSWEESRAHTIHLRNGSKLTITTRSNYQDLYYDSIPSHSIRFLGIT